MYSEVIPLTVVLAVEIMTGETVSEQISDSQEVTVTIVVCSLDSEVEIGHHVAYSVAMPLTVVVAVETTAGEVVSEQIPDSQEVTVTKVVSLFFVGTEVTLGVVV